MSTLFDKLAAQLSCVRANVEILNKQEFQKPVANINEDRHRPIIHPVKTDNTIYVGPKGGRYRITASGRRAYI